MERQQALRRVKKLLGPRAYWRIAEQQTSPERRRATRFARLDRSFAVAMIKRDMNERSRELLLADPQYQADKAEWQRAQQMLEQIDNIPNANDGYRFEVGTRDGIFVSPKAYGDTWEEVFAKLSPSCSEHENKEPQ